MEPELMTALRTAREWAEDAEDVGRLARMARVFLAQHEQVAALAAERDALAKQVQRCIDERNVFLSQVAQAQSALATARVEGAREALRYVFRQFELRPAVDKTVALEVTAYALRHKYPATGEEPTRCADVVGCDGKCCARPAPSAHAGDLRPEPSVFRTDGSLANSLRVGGSCADCDALNLAAPQAVVRTYCPKHKVSLVQGGKPMDLGNGTTMDVRGPAPTPEPEIIAPNRIWLPVQEAWENTTLTVCITQRDAAAMAQMAAQYVSRPTPEDK